MRIHFFAAPFCCFHLVQGSRFRVQGSRFKVQGSGFRVQGSGVRWRLRSLFLLGRCPEVAFKSPVTSRSYDTREGIISHAWCQILRLSLHLFWLGLFTHRAFSSAQDDDTRGRKGSYLGDMLRVWELALLYYDTSSPLEKGRAKGAGWIHAAV